MKSTLLIIFGKVSVKNFFWCTLFWLFPFVERPEFHCVFLSGFSSAFLYIFASLAVVVGNVATRDRLRIEETNRRLAAGVPIVRKILPRCRCIFCYCVEMRRL